MSYQKMLCWWLLSFMFYTNNFVAQHASSIIKNNSSIIWKDRIPSKDLSLPNHIAQLPKEYRFLELEKEALNELLIGTNPEESKQVQIPFPNGGYEVFEVELSSVMHHKLADKYPHIKTFKGKSVENPSFITRFVWTGDEFHAIAFTDQGAVFIDKVESNGQPHYISYYSKNLAREASVCESFEPETQTLDVSLMEEKAKTISPLDVSINKTQKSNEAIGSTLRTYRFVLAMAGEVTVSLGGLAAAMTRITNLVSDLNMLYETEMCVHLELIPDNDDYIFTDPSTDPYSAVDLSSFLAENMPFMDTTIGEDNYDIGHVINNTSGGVAYLGVFCFDYWKGGGTSPNDLNVLAHEIGHQMQASHSFNYCGGSGGGYEPGSGNTTMSYHGLCGYSNNMPGPELLQYHTSSYSQMHHYMHVSHGSFCSVNTATGNTAPVVTVPASGFTIPISTPFTLTGSATDNGGSAALTYSWEQNDLGSNSTPPNNPTGTAPIFMNFPYSSEPIRTIPQLSKIINGTSDIGEVLPTYTRELNFRLMVHDNDPAGGGVDYEELMFNVDGNSGPFTVTFPNSSSEIWSPGHIKTITWDVANTNMAPVNCTNVNILVSYDGGYTYPDTLASAVPNDGSQDITVPSTASTLARIKVEAADNIFFDISNANFEIVSPDANDFILSLNPSIQYRCSETSLNYQVNIAALGIFNSNVELTISGLPSGVTSNLPMTVGPNSSSTITLSNLNSLANNSYSMILTATETGGSVTKSKNLELKQIGTASSSKGSAMSFDGNDYVEINQIGNDYDFGTDQSFTVECWMKTTTNSSDDAIVGNKDWLSGSFPGWVIAIQSGRITFNIGDGSNRVDPSSPTYVYNDGKWHHLVGVLNRATNIAQLYIDGTLITEKSASILEDITTSNAVDIGIGADGRRGYRFDGEIEEVRIWRKPLTVTEIREGKHRIIDTCQPDLISYYQFNEASGDVIDPISSYNGTVNGSTRVPSTAPIGTGIANSQMETAGVVDFTNTNFSANYTQQDAASVTATKIDIAPSGNSGIDPAYTLFDSQHWIANRYEENGSLNMALTFQVNEDITSEDADTPDALKLYSRAFNEEADWTLLASASSADAINNTITFQNITSYGQYLMARCGACLQALPLNLLSFEVFPNGRSIQLIWETELEYEVDQFEIMRSIDDGNSWEPIGNLKAKDQLEKQTYTFIDNQIQFNRNYYYQLKIRDLDGTFNYSPIRNAILYSNESFSIYPNPTSGNVNIQFSNLEEDNFELKIFDLGGATAFSKKVNLTKGKTTFSFDLSHLPPAFYLAQLKIGGKVFHEKMVVEK